MPDLIIDQRRKSLGGFEVGRVLPYVRRRMVGPFIFFDHMGPADLPAGLPREWDVRPHPHIGLSTLTYLFEGEITHRDSIGSVQAICPGEVNWMTAGQGVSHSERFDRARIEGGRLHGIQSWIALPKEDEECAPDFAHYASDDLPTYEGGGLWARLVAGEAFGAKAKVATHSPLFYVHWRLAAGARAQLPADYSERAAYVVSGRVEVEGQDLAAGRMLVFEAGAPKIFTASEAAVVMLLGGEPIGERFIDWNFVSSSKDRLAQARADWQAGRIKLPEMDSGEFIPYPEPQPPSEDHR